ncbi:MAG: DinB family protein [Acidimicrobiales bacterium]|nr:DinB family protein [Acidimicrobiales bacterium]
MPMNAPLVRDERDGFVAFLQHQRQAVHNAVYGLREDQARLRPTPSGLSLGGLVTHLLYGERNWSDRIEGIPPAVNSFEQYMGSFELTEGETLASVVAAYEQASARTDAILGRADLDRRVPLPDEPWFPDPNGCTVRWIAFHLIEETARHAGHADLIREALDGGLSGPLMAAAEGWPDEGWIKPWRAADSPR